ncbi:TetR/AcrR family transcriptional regulator [Streptomyces sp. A1277]|uniref:ScbR family autoregulator-binding transcription factor n=1 Tax=Streptomyces sp. A1277 TaxID=2563103 RepID=UPI0010A2101A|nr:TetR/AcrR family transcriptional regulator [Streptomyces sp. A1277]
MQTREQLLQAAAEVFDEYGYAGAGINKILQRAGLTAGALYFHFKNKQELALEVMHAQRTAIEPHVSATGLQRLVDITLIWSHSLQADPVLRAGVRLTSEQATFGLRDATPYAVWAGSFVTCLEAARDAGELRRHVRIEELAEFVVGACTGMQEYAQVVCGRADLPRRTVNMWQVLLPGIATDTSLVSVEVNEDRAAALWAKLGAAEGREAGRAERSGSATHADEKGNARA